MLLSARALNAPLLVPFNKSYVSPLISLVGALMVNTNLNLLGFLEASGRSRSSLGSSRALPSPPIYPFIPLLLSCQQGWHAPWAPWHILVAQSSKGLLRPSLVASPDVP